VTKPPSPSDQPTEIALARDFRRSPPSQICCPFRRVVGSACPLKGEKGFSRAIARIAFRVELKRTSLSLSATLVISRTPCADFEFG